MVAFFWGGGGCTELVDGDGEGSQFDFHSAGVTLIYFS